MGHINSLEELVEWSYYSGTAIKDVQGTVWIVYDGLVYEPASHMLGVLPEQAWDWGPFDILWVPKEDEWP